MANRTRELVDRWSWLAYPVGAVVVGGILGGAAGNHPRGPDPFVVPLTRDTSFLIDTFWVGLVVAAGSALLGFFSGFTECSGAFRRLANGCGCAISGALIVLIGLGTPVAVCLALAALSWWAGLGAGPKLGAASVAGAIGLGAICLWHLGRPLGRYMIRKQREALEGLEEEVADRP